jgi:Cu/Ag efflux protein CusF
MKTFIAPTFIVLMTAGTCLPGIAQTDHSAHMKAPAPASAAATAPLSDGLVKKVDKANKKVTLSHGPLPNGMPAMTMSFGVTDSSWLNKLKVGDKINFSAEMGKNGPVVNRYELAK